MFLAIFFIVFFAGVAMMVKEGLWSNTLNTIGVVLSGILALGLYQPLTIMLDEKTEGSYTYLLDIVVLYGLFVVVNLIVKLLMGAFSKTRMRFRRPIDDVGGPAMAVVGGFLLAAFVMATLHTSPLSKDVFGGALNYGETLGDVKNEVESTGSLMHPDLMFLRLTEKLLGKDMLGDGKFKAHEYIFTHGDHRKKFETTETAAVRRS